MRRNPPRPTPGGDGLLAPSLEFTRGIVPLRGPTQQESGGAFDNSPDGAILHPYPAPQEGACALTYQRGSVTAAARAGGPANRLDFLDASQFRESHRLRLLDFLEFFRQNPDFSMS